jgi:hypothetical protein
MVVVVVVVLPFTHPVSLWIGIISECKLAVEHQ